MIRAVFFLLLILAGCVPHVGFQDSGIEPPDDWNTPAETIEEVEQDWWKHFKDPTLDTLLSIALVNNKNVAIAVARIAEARAARLYAWSVLFPQFSLAGDASRGNQGFLTNGQTISQADIMLQVNWEVDVFGKNRAKLAAADALVQHEVIMRQAAIVGLLAEVARNYFDARNYQKQIAITTENLETQKKTLKLTQDQMQGGLSSNFDVERANAQVSVTAARIPTLQISYGLAVDRLNVLLGQTIGTIDELLECEMELPPLDQKILVAAPATVLATRPDVRAAERNFAQTIYLHVAALRECLPTINLLGFFGAQAMTLFNTAPTWNIATNFTSPVIDFGKVQSDIDATDARQLRAFLTYQETVLEALEDLQNALYSYLYEFVRNRYLREAAEQNRKAEALANQQYANGFTGLLDLLIVQRNTLEAESALADSDILLRKDLVNIYTASGGGWACY